MLTRLKMIWYNFWSYRHNSEYDAEIDSTINSGINCMIAARDKLAHLQSNIEALRYESERLLDQHIHKRN